MTRSPVLMTCGEPSGIGPELAQKAWQCLRNEMVFCWIGDPDILPNPEAAIKIKHPSLAAQAMKNGLPVLPHAFSSDVQAGHPNPANAASVIDIIARAVEYVQNNDASAICTAPIHKKALQDGAGFGFPGHTEYLAHLGSVEHAVMILVSPHLRVVPTTIHIPIEQVPDRLSQPLLERTISITRAALIDKFNIADPRLAITGLNPHAGEGGKMGSQETDVIIPVIERLKAKGWHLTGPHSADTLFHDRARASYDAVIAMYHDQALIPIKTLDFDRGVNVTLGLPFVRTSPDHGTALDIAGQGIANATSTIEALRLAAKMGASS
ncbi:MAG: 4-hydroxythreonine-4-phosphate dehydrogenase PdxA [Paracoccaceae bacterium]|nr:4-hydroxythreonine-4-phosphate dehydrogenase PdxA [Paracoccaceae bacterium]